MYKVLIVLFISIPWPFSVSAAETAEVHKKLWAGLSVPEPVFQTIGIEKMSIYFAVVNDGTSTVDPEIGASRLLINGIELKRWRHIISNGPRGPDFAALPAGRACRFTYQLGELFRQPGTYTVRWEGRNFQSRDLTFRVLLARQ
jgi:hypothetical protein